MKKNMIKLAGVACAVALCAALAACAPATQSTTEDAAGGVHTEMADTGDGMYVSDEQCLSCHGGSYDALAETTACRTPTAPFTAAPTPV